MSLEIVSALGPGSQLASLNKSTASYKAATTNFTDLLQYPFLQSIVLSEGGKNDQDLHTIVTDGSSRFNQLCTADISIAQQVNSYGRTVPILLKALTVGDYAVKTQPLISQYVREAAENSSGNEVFFRRGISFKEYLLLLDEQIALMESKITNLTGKIENASVELANANVGQVIGDVIKSLFKIAADEDGDVQLATLLSVGIETITSSFTQLWADQKRLKELIKSLTTLKDNLTAIKKLFSALSSALVDVISNTKSLLSMWTDVEARLATVESIDRKVTDLEHKQVVDEWIKAQEAATAYINAISKSGSTTTTRIMSTRALKVGASTVSKVPKIPRTKGEIKIALLLAIAKAQGNEVTPSSVDAALDNNPNVSDSDKDKLLKVAGPPSDTQAILDEMALQTSGVMQQFDELLQIPFLDQLQCNDPDQSSKKINIQKMVTDYQKMYWDLQQETVPVAQDLQTYSKTVLALLPKLVTTSTAAPGQVTVQTYLSAHQMLADEYKTQADDIFNKSLLYKNKWDNAINAVVQAINECKTNITTWEATIADLSKEIKKLTLKAVLMGVGALACFAAAAFVPGGMLASGLLVSAGLVLLEQSIQAIADMGKLLATINELKARIEIARDTQQKLQHILPFMQEIANSLTKITAVWSDITQGLNDVQAWNLLLATPLLLDIARPELLNSWTAIRDATQKYIDIVTDRKE